MWLGHSLLKCCRILQQPGSSMSLVARRLLLHCRLSTLMATQTTRAQKLTLQQQRRPWHRSGSCQIIHVQNDYQDGVHSPFQVTELS